MRFNIGLTPQEKADLIAFLNSLRVELLFHNPAHRKPPYAMLRSRSLERLARRIVPRRWDATEPGPCRR